MVPTAVAGVFFGLDVIAPVDLHEWHAMFYEPPTEQARLAKTRFAIAFDDLSRLLRQIEHLASAWRCQEREGLGTIIVDGMSGAQQLSVAFQVVERLHQALALAEALGRQIGGRLQRRE